MNPPKAADTTQPPPKAVSDAAMPDAKPISPDRFSEVIKKNIELAETNKTLRLLRQIDEAVLGGMDDIAAVIDRIATVVAEDSGFSFAAIYLQDKRQRILQPKAVVTRIGDPTVQRLLHDQLLRQPISLRHPNSPAVRALQQSLIVTAHQLFEAVQPVMPIETAEEVQAHLSLVSFFICPLHARHEAFGVMVVGSSQSPDELGFYQRSLLERLTVAVGIAIDNALLYCQIQEAATHLRQANRHLKELDKAKDEFISIASHQLRTPLTSIKNYISMLLEDNAGPLTPTQHEFLVNAYSNSKRMAGLISDLLNLSRITAGKFTLEKTPVDLDRLVGEEVQQLQRQAHSRKLTLEYKPPSKPLPLINLDERKIREVMMNFIDNAIYYTTAGSIQVTLEQHGKHVELRVQDTGIGVPQSARPRLFSEFFRARNAQAMRPDGSGVGLFLAKRVIEDHGGDIIFESVENQGSVFGFSLPLDAKPPQRLTDDQGSSETDLTRDSV